MSEISDQQKLITSDMIASEVEQYLRSINLNFVTRKSTEITRQVNLKKFIYFNTETLNIIADYVELSGYNKELERKPYIMLVCSISGRNESWNLTDISALRADLEKEILPLKKNRELEALQRLIKIVELVIERMDKTDAKNSKQTPGTTTIQPPAIQSRTDKYCA